MRPGAYTDRKAPPPCGRELEVLTVVLVSQILEREIQAELLAATSQRHTPAKPLHREAVERQEVLCDPERRRQQRRRDARDVGLRPDPILGPPAPARLGESHGGENLHRRDVVRRFAVERAAIERVDALGDRSAHERGRGAEREQALLERERRVCRQLDAMNTDVRVVRRLHQRARRRHRRGQILHDEVRILIHEEIGAARDTRGG